MLGLTLKEFAAAVCPHWFPLAVSTHVPLTFGPHRHWPMDARMVPSHCPPMLPPMASTHGLPDPPAYRPNPYNSQQASKRRCKHKSTIAGKRVAKAASTLRAKSKQSKQASELRKQACKASERHSKRTRERESERAGKQADKQSGKKAGKQARKQTRKQANGQASKHASKASMRVGVQASTRASTHAGEQTF